MKKVMIWGCFSSNGVGVLHRCEGNMNQEKYLNVLSSEMMESGQQIFAGKPFIFQQDNAPCHKTKWVVAYLKQEQDDGILSVLEWPLHSLIYLR